MKPFTLPTSARRAFLMEPRCMVLYANPGTGKTPIALSLGQLDRDSVAMFDTHQGALHYDGLIYDICQLAQESGDPKWRIYLEMCRQVRLNKKIKFLVVDHVAHLADWADNMALELFAESPVGKSWPNKDENGVIVSRGCADWQSILELPGPKGSAGWGRLWDAFQRLTEAAHLGAHYRTIFIGHPMQRIAFAAAQGPDATTNLKQDDLASAAELDLGGPKMKKDFCSTMDAIGCMQRAWEAGRIEISFKAKDAFTRTRCEHLEGRKLWFSCPTPDKPQQKTTLAEWARIYPQTLREHLTPEDAKALAPLLAKYEGGAA